MSKEHNVWHQTKTQHSRSCLRELYHNSYQLVSSLKTYGHDTFHQESINKRNNTIFLNKRPYSEEALNRDYSQPAIRSFKNRRTLRFENDYHSVKDLSQLSVKSPYKNIIIQACLMRNNKKKIKIFNFKHQNDEQRSQLQAYSKLILSRTPLTKKLEGQAHTQSLLQTKKLKQLHRRKSFCFQKLNRQKEISAWELDNCGSSDQF